MLSTLIIVFVCAVFGVILRPIWRALLAASVFGTGFGALAVYIKDAALRLGDHPAWSQDLAYLVPSPFSSYWAIVPLACSSCLLAAFLGGVVRRSEPAAIQRPAERTVRRIGKDGRYRRIPNMVKVRASPSQAEARVRSILNQ